MEAINKLAKNPGSQDDSKLMNTFWTEYKNTKKSVPPDSSYKDPIFPPESSSLCKDWSIASEYIASVKDRWDKYIWKRAKDIPAL